MDPRRIRDRLAGFPGVVCFHSRNLDSGADFGLRADERVRAASTIKLPIMVAAFASVAAGKASWDEPLLLREEEKIGGSGVLTEFSGGLRLPLGDLVHLMIVVSDNTATNLVLDRIGADAVNEQMDLLGLRETRCLRKVRGDGQQLRPPAGFSKAGLIPENQRFGLGVSTPREMVVLLEKLERGEVVSAEASNEMVAILRRQQSKDGIGRREGTVVASKSGSLDALRSDVGIVYSPGARIAMAITVDDMPRPDWSPENAGLLLIADLAAILTEELRSP